MHGLCWLTESCGTFGFTGENRESKCEIVKYLFYLITIFNLTGRLLDNNMSLVWLKL